jgi:hypothetical protein
MKQIAISLDAGTAATLAMQIDDSMPTVEDVARHVLAKASAQRLEDVGFRQRACVCGSLERAAGDRDSPIVFDTETNEFLITKESERGQYELIVRYCFSCGGNAPASKRKQLFAWISGEEKVRLARLCADVHTIEDAVRSFGAPDYDSSLGLISETTSEDGRRESTIHRSIVYGGLSESADVRFTHVVGDRVCVSFSGKYLRAKKVAD